MNSQITFTDCTSWNNNKGWDQGTHNIYNMNAMYKHIRSLAYSNNHGINFVGPGTAGYSGTVTFYLIDSIIRDNCVQGSNVYGSPRKLYFVHNVYDNNGAGTCGSTFNVGNIGLNPDGVTDGGHIEDYLYNNIFYKPATMSNLQQKFWSFTATDYSLESDYNSWV